MRSKQRNKKKPINEKVQQLVKWPATFREKCIRSSANEPSYDDKWRRYKPTKMFSVDQSPLAFVIHGKKTYEYNSPTWSMIYK